MKIDFKSVTFKNILSYGNNPTTVNINSGLIALTGYNGQGKSVLLDAISFCLYGKPYRDIKITELINRKNKKETVVSIQFVVDNSQEFTLTRGIKPDILELIQDKTTLNLLSSKKLNQVEIDKILGINYDLFKQIISLSINQTKPFLTLKAQEKRDLVEQIFNVKVIGEMVKYVKKENSELKVKKNMADSVVTILDSNIRELKSQIIDIDDAQKEFAVQKAKDISGVETQIKSDSSELVGVGDQIKEAESKLNNVPQNKEIVTLAKEFEEATGEITSSRAMLRDIEKNISVNEIKITNIKNQENNKNENIKNYENEITSNNLKIKNNNEQIKNYNEQITNLPEQKNIENIEKIINENNINLNELNSNLLKNEKIISIKETEINTTSKFLNKLQTIDVCPTCNNSITETYKNNEKQKSEETLESLRLEIERKSKSISVIKGEIENTIKTNEKLINDIKTIQKQNQEITTKKTTLQNDIKNLKVIENELKTSNNNYEQKINELKNTSNETGIENITDIENTITNLQNQITVIESNQIKLNEKALQLQNKIKQIENQNDRNNSERKLVGAEIEHLKESKSKLERNLQNLKIQLEEVKTREFGIDVGALHSQYDSKLQELGSTKKELDSTTFELLTNEKILGVLSETGIKSFIFKKIVPVMNQTINKYLEYFNLQVLVEFDEVMEETIKITGHHTDVSYASFSEGEKKRIDMAILLSFIKITKHLANWNCNLLIVDELLDSSIDEAGLEKLLDSLKTVAMESDNQSIVIISHRQELLPQFNTVYRVEKNSNGFSVLRKKD